MPIEKIRLRDIDNNPFRDLEGNPLRRDQIDRLLGSINSTGFWDGLMVRPHPSKPQRYQLVYGHARLVAAREHGVTDAVFSIRDLDDDTMIRAMADENVTQFGRDEYKTYREAVTAAVERIMGQVIAGTISENIFGNHGPGAQAIHSGDGPGIDVIGRYFKGTLPLGPLRLALREYRDSGRLAAWHAQHNPQAEKRAQPTSLNSAALSRFTETSHVKEFADTAQRLGLAVDQQEYVADFVLSSLKVPDPDTRAKSARGKRASEQFARTEQPRNERLTQANIRRVMTEFRAKRSRSSKEKARLQAEAYAISIESAVVEMSIGLKRAAKAGADLMAAADAIGGLHVDMTPTTLTRMMECGDALRTIETTLKKAASVGIKTIRVVGGQRA